MNAVEGETRYIDKIDYRPSDVSLYSLTIHLSIICQDEIRFVIDILDVHSKFLSSAVEDSIPSTTIESIQKLVLYCRSMRNK